MSIIPYQYFVVNVFYFISLYYVLWISSYVNYLSYTLSVLDFFMTWVVYCILFFTYNNLGPLGGIIMNGKFGIIDMFGCVQNIHFLLHNNCTY